MDKILCDSHPECNMPEDFNVFRSEYRRDKERGDKERAEWHKKFEVNTRLIEKNTRMTEEMHTAFHDTEFHKGLFSIIKDFEKITNKFKEDIFPQFHEMKKQQEIIRQDVKAIKKETTLTRFFHRCFMVIQAPFLWLLFALFLGLLVYGMEWKEYLSKLLGLR